ncbi:MAG: ABC transporter ATP-binding protein [Pseudomonadota bacterium]|nr:ABC transporter ATP-binding protein [Pseudomonadota bacterium]
MTDAMIVTRNLFVTLPSQAGAVNIIRGIDLSISSGETVGLIGPSGSGKSTLLMVLAGLEPASQGQVIVSGHDYADMDEDALSRFRRSNVGIVFQSFHLVPTMTAVENVALPLELAGVGSAFEKAEAMLEEVGLSHRLTHYPAQMSGGEQQRTALARALVANPPVLFADEPTGNLDQNTGRQIMDLILRLAEERGTTVLLITHDRALADRCARVETMQDGRLLSACDKAS